MKRPVRNAGRIAGRIVVAVLAAFIFSCALVMLFEEKFIYFPSPYAEDTYAEGGRDATVEECYFTTSDGLRLHGRFYSHDAPAATILLFHGNAGNLSHRHALCRAYRDLGYNVFIPDYRGYGRSEGEPSESGLFLDAEAAYDFIRSRDGGKTPVVLFGSSLGGAVAVDLATRRDAAALVLESTFTSAADVAALHYSFLPVRMLLRTKFDSARKIRGIGLPALFIHGDEDTIVPVSLGRALFDAAPGPKEFVTIRGAGHNDLQYRGGREYLEAIDRFIRSRVAGGTAGGGDRP